MSGNREAFLQRVREAVVAGNRPGDVAAAPSRNGAGCEDPTQDALQLFRDRLAAAGGQLYEVADTAAAREQVLNLLGSIGAKSVLLGHGTVIDSLSLSNSLDARGIRVFDVAGLASDNRRETFFTADAAVSGTEHLLADSGSLVQFATKLEPRSLTLLPPVHIAIATRHQLLADLFDLFEMELIPRRQSMPSCVTLITGPSKTGDIELKLVTGVHGPGHVHVVLLN